LQSASKAISGWVLHLDDRAACTGAREAPSVEASGVAAFDFSNGSLVLT